ncbi:hypothetical protein MADA3029_1080040 [Vibrio nigripulchritudo MADA3029]|nr:hypothetical protein MADA3029_1080040 [Vibrio nigripulchritudo MADA3029]
MHQEPGEYTAQAEGRPDRKVDSAIQNHQQHAYRQQAKNRDMR